MTLLKEKNENIFIHESKKNIPIALSMKCLELLLIIPTPFIAFISKQVDAVHVRVHLKSNLYLMKFSVLILPLPPRARCRQLSSKKQKLA